MTHTAHAQAVKPAVEALDTLDTLRDTYMRHTGADSRPTVRTDMLGGIGLVITYASTSTYALESRASGDGRFMHRVNREWYKSAADIPLTYRKARAIASSVESANAIELIAAQRAYETAYSAYRSSGL